MNNQDKSEAIIEATSVDSFTVSNDDFSIKVIIEAIQQACPELMELKFGCYFSSPAYNNIRIIHIHQNHPFYFVATVMQEDNTINMELDIQKSSITVLGSPITLYYVLKYIGNKRKSFIAEEYMVEIDGYMVKAKWDFSKPDDLQIQLQDNPPLVDLLYSLLT